jgi:predicted  nucleic acid-binding Zn-ribbon protein
MDWLEQLRAELGAAKAQKRKLKRLLRDANGKAKALDSKRKRLNLRMKVIHDLLDRNFIELSQNESVQDDLETKLSDIERTIELHVFLPYSMY